MELAPIALFTYKRLDHTMDTVNALTRNSLAGKSELFVFSDGPRGAADVEEVHAVRAYLKTIAGFKEIHIIESEENKGLARSITNGVSAILKNHDQVIVLEDDIVTSPYFLDFMNEALQLYENEQKVMHINGYFFAHTAPLPPYFFSGDMLCWGWATWKRAWIQFSPNISDNIEAITTAPDFKQKHYLKNTLSTLLANKNGKKLTWAASWHASIIKAGGLCLTPSTSFTKNLGLDGSGENSENDTPFITEVSADFPKLTKQPVVENIPSVAIIDETLRRARGSIIKRLLGRIKKII